MMLLDKEESLYVDVKWLVLTIFPFFPPRRIQKRPKLFNGGNEANLSTQTGMFDTLL
jgi:hypothetical protein